MSRNFWGRDGTVSRTRFVCYVSINIHFPTTMGKWENFLIQDSWNCLWGKPMLIQQMICEEKTKSIWSTWNFFLETVHIKTRGVSYQINNKFFRLSVLFIEDSYPVWDETTYRSRKLTVPDPFPTVVYRLSHESSKNRGTDSEVPDGSHRTDYGDNLVT